MNTIELTISGMTCQGCVKSVTRVLEALPGVKRTDVAIGRATVEFDPAVQNADKLRSAIEDAGFDVA
ncbi:MAG: heavy-metal-associated domain-containing protein [Microvirgula sp.]